MDRLNFKFKAKHVNNPYIKLKGYLCVCLCVKVKISLTAEQCGSPLK